MSRAAGPGPGHRDGHIIGVVPGLLIPGEGLTEMIGESEAAAVAHFESQSVSESVTRTGRAPSRRSPADLRFKFSFNLSCPVQGFVNFRTFRSRRCRPFVVFRTFWRKTDTIPRRDPVSVHSMSLS